ncbi:helix-turn-helix domain-containing protein [Streptomyces sp. V4I2]|uniref:helix-turn-helix domain-containing protein n=1 Tax=Streptomyces sp. V4I2 TaxID=3042280 RepID=UPI00278A13E4|nr:helix-turn-helix domain-containing protein [Streptomyces sp. V4I2]MDQ1044313.1 DNA-binding transcriptional MocR family regulator [Streptomyces sp. V4I2]
MSDGAKKKGAPYKVQYERHILRVAKLKNPTHALVALAFIGYANPDGTNQRPPSMETIAGDLGLSVRTVQRACEALEEAGLFERLSRGTPGKSSHWRFVVPSEDRTAVSGVVEVEEQKDRTPLTGTPDSLDENTGQPCQEDRTALSAYQDKDQHTTNTTTNTEAAPFRGRARVDDVWAQVEAEAYERNHYEELSTRHLLERFELGAPVGAL